MAYAGPWYGESYRLDGSNSSQWLSWRYHFDGLSAPLDGGAIVGAYADGADPAAFAAFDQPITVRWVIEVAGPGTIAIRAGLDPSWSYSDPTLATQDLGVLTSSGPGTLVSAPITVIDHAGLVAQDAPVIAYLQGDGIQVVQVKLRVWPSSGAGGSWQLGPQWTRLEQNVERWYATVNEGTPQLPTFEAAWDQQRELMSRWGTFTGVQYATSTGGTSAHSFFYVFGNQLTAPFTPSGSAGASIALVMARPGRPAPDPSLQYGFDPNEVWREERAYIRGVGGGPATTAFDRWTDDATISPSDVGGTLIAGEALAGEPDLIVDPDDPRFRRGQFYFPRNWVHEVDPLPLWQFGTGPFVAFSVMGSAYYPPAPTADTFTSGNAQLSDLLPFLTRIENYDYYSPAAPPSSQPRFFVKHRDDSMRPVGFGKPATELTVLRVPGGGRWRDLTTDEYATYGPTVRPPGGVALKVKRLDAGGSVWWDQVGWMVPDA